MNANPARPQNVQTARSTFGMAVQNCAEGHAKTVFDFQSLGGQVKTGHFVDGQNRPFLAATETSEFYCATSSARKSVWTLVRQLRGPHLSTWA